MPEDCLTTAETMMKMHEDCLTTFQEVMNFCISILMRTILSVMSGVSALFQDFNVLLSSNTSCLEAHAGFFRLLMKGVFDPYVL